MSQTEEWENVSMPKELHDDIVEDLAPGQSKWGKIQEYRDYYKQNHSGDAE